MPLSPPPHGCRLQENPYIHSGYRSEFTFRQALSSVLQLHSESFNIWSHLLGFLGFASLLRWFVKNAGSELQDRHHSWSLEVADLTSVSGDAARWPLYLFMAGACCCLLTSTVAHTFACMSKRVHSLIWKGACAACTLAAVLHSRSPTADYAGIVVLIACSFAPPIHYAFFCEPVLMTIYLSAIGIASLFTLFFVVAPRFAGPTWRGYRAITFSALGGMGVVPILHQVVHWELLHRGEGGMPRPLRVAFQLEWVMGCTYWLGAYLFAKRWPECRWPGKLDLAWSSHNLFHLLVIVAACIHVEASLILLAWRDRTQCT